MRRSICYCEPSVACAGEVRTWKFIYSPATNLPKGARLKFDLQSPGRKIDWELPQVGDSKNGGGTIYAIVGKNKAIQAKEIENPQSFAPQYEFVLPAGVPAGEIITIVLGAPEGTQTKGKKGEKIGVRSQTTVQRRRPFLLYISPSGKNYSDEPEVFNMDIKGGELAHIRVLTPSFVSKNKRFDITVRFEDEFGNLTSNAPEDTLIELSHEHIRENLNWKLFIPETGFISLPNFYFNEEGVYTIQLHNITTKAVFSSSPIRCFSETSRFLFWGGLHTESDRFDSTENIENCIRHFRDDKALNFYASSPFESQEETSNDIWKLISQNVADFDENDRFTTFLGFQWIGEPHHEGVRYIIYAKDTKPILRKKDIKYSSLKKIYKSFSPKELISIPTFTMAKGFEFNFDHFDPDFERVVEIYNAWGCSELTKKEGNSFPISENQGKAIQESAEGAVQKALMRNFRFGFVAGGLDDRGLYADFYDSEQEQYTPGLTAIIAPIHSREALLEALYQRSCYATTGERIIVGIYIAGIPMGREISTADKPGLVVNRHISGYVAGTTKLKSVEIIRNGKVIKSFQPDDYHLDFTYDDFTNLDKVCIDPKDKRTPFVFYYLRVIQDDGHMAWSSPIWVDYVPLSSVGRQSQKRALLKPSAKSSPAETFEDEDEDEDEDFEFEE